MGSAPSNLFKLGQQAHYLKEKTFVRGKPDYAIVGPDDLTKVRESGKFKS